MKTTKRIFAALLTVMMVLMMVPFTASAATTGNFTIDAAPTGFTLSVFKIADLNETTGEYTPVQGAKDDLKTAVNSFANGSSATKLNTDLDAIANEAGGEAAVAEALGASVVATVTDMKAVTVKDKGAGLYYIKPCSDGVPSTYTKAAGSVVAAPEYNTESKRFEDLTSAVKIGSTKASSSTVSVKKTIVADASYTTSAENNGIIYGAISNTSTPVSFKLTASNVGSVDAPVQSYIIADTMDAGLTFDASSVEVSVAGAPLSANDYTVKQGVSYTTTEKTENYTFAVELNKSVIADNSKGFYNTGAEVEVTYKATINDKAEIKKAINNTDYLLYKNNSTQSSKYETVPGNTVKVYTLAVGVVKMNANDNKRLAGAVMGLYKSTDTKCENPVATVTTTATEAFDTFKKADGSVFTAKAGEEFKIKEIAAPTGFVLSTEEVPVTVSASLDANGELSLDDADKTNDGTFTMQFNNRKVVVPTTGGAGTIAFTIVGISLIVVAGVLFLVVRKRSAK